MVRSRSRYRRPGAAQDGPVEGGRQGVIAINLRRGNSASTAPRPQRETGAANVASSGSTRRMVVAQVRPELHSYSDPCILPIKRG